MLNTIQGNYYEGGGTIGGGGNNSIQPTSVFDGNNPYGASSYSTIGGGYANQIQSNAVYSTIAGGLANSIQTGSYVSMIAGGQYNSIAANAPGSFISSGTGNAIQSGSFNGVIGGGQSNLVQTASQDSVIGGGFGNTVFSNAPFSTIGGGLNNTVSNSFAVVPGGVANTASGQYSLAAGQQAQALHQGAFVWADSQNVPFSSTVSNQFSVRAQGGARFVTGGAGMTLDGLPILSGSNGGGLTNVNAALLNGLPASAFAAASGSTNYIQNQNAGPQAASFNIGGNATVGGTAAANALVITNSIRFPGAGVGTTTAAFIQVSAATNIVGDTTFIYNPLSDGDPNAILIVTHNYNPGETLYTYNNKPVGVWYNGAHWGIFNEDQSAMTNNIAFNVLIIKH
jgi:hypothetical protein